MRWNWRCKMFSRKIRRCKFLDKFHVWSFDIWSMNFLFESLYLVLGITYTIIFGILKCVSGKWGCWFSIISTTGALVVVTVSVVSTPSIHYTLSDMKFVKKITPPDFQAKNFTPSISPNFNSFGKKKHKKWVKMEKFTPLAKILHSRLDWRDGQIPPLAGKVTKMKKRTEKRSER